MDNKRQFLFQWLVKFTASILVIAFMIFAFLNAYAMSVDACAMGWVNFVKHGTAVLVSLVGVTIFVSARNVLV